MTPKIPQPPKKQYKTVKIPYFKNENFIFDKTQITNQADIRVSNAK